jgi:hypothetical protein
MPVLASLLLPKLARRLAKIVEIAGLNWLASTKAGTLSCRIAVLVNNAGAAN